MAEDGHKVALNVYDLSQGLARQLSTSFLGKAIEGIWHTGIVVFGKEYYFGGGIQSGPEGQTPYGKPLKVVELGFTHVPKDVFEEYLQEISPRYTTETYSLLQHNCNNFSDEISQFLLGVSIPDFILKLPEEVISSPMGALIMPMIQQFETILRHGGVPQVPHAVPFQGTPNFSQIQVPSAAASSPVSTFVNVHSQNSLPESATSRQADVLHSASVSAAPASTGAESSGKKVASGAGSTSSVTDKLEAARARVQEEITLEFAALMAEGRLRASEAAALAARRVMERHGSGGGLASKS